jgi:hypothetical protein
MASIPPTMSTTSARTPPGVPAPARRREVFYAAYGSNLSAERFACYIAGGTAPGARRALPGARDRRQPESWRALRVPGRLYFSGHSQTWGGAPAFFEPTVPAEHPGAEVFARAWRLGWDQLEDVMAQESGRHPTALDVEPGAVVEGFSVRAGPGRYDRLVCLGTLEGLPVLTCTAVGLPEAVTPAAPSLEYLAHIIIGLREAFDLDDPAIVDYLGCAAGASPDLVRAALALDRLKSGRSKGERYVT